MTDMLRLTSSLSATCAESAHLQDVMEDHLVHTGAVRIVAMDHGSCGYGYDRRRSYRAV